MLGALVRALAPVPRWRRTDDGSRSKEGDEVNVNVCVLTGNLTRDPEMAELPSGAQVCRLRVAMATRERVDGEWVDRPNYFDVSVFGAQGESASRYLSKGRAVAIQGQLRWREWQTDEGERRQAVSITASQVQFLGPPPSDQNRDERRGGDAGPQGAAEQLGADEDELPF